MYFSVLGLWSGLQSYWPSHEPGLALGTQVTLQLIRCDDDECGNTVPGTSARGKSIDWAQVCCGL